MVTQDRASLSSAVDSRSNYHMHDDKPEHGACSTERDRIDVGACPVQESTKAGPTNCERQTNVLVRPEGVGGRGWKIEERMTYTKSTVMIPHSSPNPPEIIRSSAAHNSVLKKDMLHFQ